MPTELLNPRAAVNDVERANLMSGYSQYTRDISAIRQAQFSHFMQIHLVLLPAHVALISNQGSSFSVIYSFLVAVLGVTFCYTSYLRISTNYRHMEISYETLHEVEKDYPYRFYTVIGEKLAAQERRKHRFSLRPRRAELVFHWIIGTMYMCLPLIHYSINHFRSK